eukprot:GHRQ01023396.1.p1 GENE.GHRQ01023396.1~~GHRQ01023396.1.p1  ORF type:complete len:131 (+),score=5.30 GHRQ01023396.1:1091-1483(+)
MSMASRTGRPSGSAATGALALPGPSMPCFSAASSSSTVPPSSAANLLSRPSPAVSMVTASLSASMAMTWQWRRVGRAIHAKSQRAEGCKHATARVGGQQLCPRHAQLQQQHAVKCIQSGSQSSVFRTMTS